jgi:hypothetical protein
VKNVNLILEALDQIMENQRFIAKNVERLCSESKLGLSFPMDCSGTNAIQKKLREAVKSNNALDSNAVIKF